MFNIHVLASTCRPYLLFIQDFCSTHRGLKINKNSLNIFFSYADEFKNLKQSANIRFFPQEVLTTYSFKHQYNRFYNISKSYLPCVIAGRQVFQDGGLS